MAEIDIKQLKEQISIVSVIKQYTSLKKQYNGEYKGLCPLHNDSNESFFVNPDKGLWHCFGGCGGGDVIKFIELAEGIDFIQAIKHLTGEDKIELSNKYNFNSFDADDLFEFIEDLKDDQKPNFDDEIVDRYFGNNHKYFLEQGFKQETLDFFKIGFCYDMSDLHNRAIIPWWDVNDNLVAIVGRDKTDKSEAKYKAKFSSNKQTHLYNLNIAKKYAKNGIIIVESEKDVWRLKEFGFDNVVALGNLDIGDRKWLLMQYTTKAIICLDNDSPGKKAAKKLIKELKPLMEVCQIQLKGVKDVSEILAREYFMKFYNEMKEVG